MVIRVLKHKCSLDIEVLAIISGRIWRVLEQKMICNLFLEQLANTEYGYSGFSQLLADVLYMPGMREHILQALRSPNRSDKLSRYVGRLFG